MSLDQTLSKATSAIYTKFLTTLAKSEPALVAVMAGGASSVLIAAGVTMEVLDQQQIVSALGPDALKAYQAAAPTNVLQLMGRAMAGDLKSPGQVLQGIGLWAVIGTTSVAYAATKLIKGLDFVKELVEKEARGDRPRGATRIDQFNEQLGAVTKAYDTPAPKNEPGFRGMR